jgi:hypothetical protein
MLLLKIYDSDRFRRLQPEQVSGNTTNTGTFEGSPQPFEKPQGIMLRPNYPIQRVEPNIPQKPEVSVVNTSFKILTEDLKHHFSTHRERFSSSRKQSARDSHNKSINSLRENSAKRRRQNRSVALEKTAFEQSPLKPSVRSEKPLKAFGGARRSKKPQVPEVIEGTRIPKKDFIDISLNRGKLRTKSDLSTKEISHYKSTFPDSVQTSYFINPGESPGVKSQCLLVTQLSTTATANHLWLRHSSRIRIQSLGTMSPAILSYPLNEELPRSHLRKESTELIQSSRSLLKSAKLLVRRGLR